MSLIRPFKGLRPRRDLASQVASLPYDVLSSDEAKALAEGNPHSFYHVGKPEIDLPPDTDIHADAVYAKGAENLQNFIKNGVLAHDPQSRFYFYEQTMGDIVQVGLVATVAVDEYEAGLIKKHELTRADKEQDRTRHIDETNAQSGPVFLAYKARPDIDSIVNDWIKRTPENDLTAHDKIRHRLWVVDDEAVIAQLKAKFAEIPALYVADGHHRSASACNVRKMRRQRNPKFTPQDACNFFMAVIFPHNQLHIFDYNRLVKDLHGLSREQFLAKVQEKFTVETAPTAPYRPEGKHTFGMYLDKKWHKLTAKPGTYNDADPIDSLDVQIMQKNLLDPILGIQDPRKDKRIDFVGGIRGLKELEKRVDSDGFAVAFSMHPTSMDDLFRVADAGQIMPPKSTWFEPKLRDGLVTHTLD